MRAAILLLLAFCGWPDLASAQTYTLAPPPYLIITDSSNNPVNAGCIWTYNAGTTTEVDTYSNSTGTLNANPIIADSAGRFTVYLSPGSSYKFTYENIPCSAASHGSVIKTQDNIAAVPVSGLNVDVTGTAALAVSAGDLVYLSDGSGSLTAGQWYAADADTAYSSTTAIAIGFATAAISATASGTIRTTGRMTGLTGLTTGSIYYASATAGGLTATPPTNARCVGRADSTTTLIIPCNPIFRLNRPTDPGGRCTLTTATAVTTADVTAATTLYYTPYSKAATPNEITLYDGSTYWIPFTLSELSIAVPATTNTMYDVYVYNNSGTPALELTAWTNDTTRATALTTQNSVYVKTGATTRRYVCSFRTTGSSGQTEDSFAKRYVWNYYNRVERLGRVLEATNTWTYTTDTLRQANGSTANQLDFVVGVAEVMLVAQVTALAGNSDAGNIRINVGIGEDSTTTQMTNVIGRFMVAPSGQQRTVSAWVQTYPAVGRHYYVWLEASEATGTTTWIGDNGGTNYQSGIFGWIEG